MKRINAWKTFSAALCILFSAQGYTAVSPASKIYLEAKLKELEALAENSGDAALIAGNGILIANHVISVTPELSVGDFYQGGIVFFVDDTKRHGLAVALQPPTTATGIFSNLSPNGATTPGQRMFLQGAGLGSGAANTAVMVAFEGMSTATVGAALTAGPLAAGYSTDAATGLDTTYCSLPVGGGAMTSIQPNCMHDWYLPNAQEWLVLASTLSIVNPVITGLTGTAIGTGDYWMSNTNNGTGGSGTATPTGTDAYYISDPTATTPTAVLTSDWTLTKEVRTIRRF